MSAPSPAFNSFFNTSSNVSMAQFLIWAQSVESQLKGTPINVQDSAFGAVGDGSADDTSAISAAIAAAVASTYKPPVFFPRGRYKHTGITVPADVTLFGEDRYSSVLAINSATANGISIDGSYAGLVNLGVDTIPTRTAGAHIVLTSNASNNLLEGLHINAPFIGIQTNAANAILRARNINIDDTVATTGRSIEVLGGFVMYFESIVARNGTGARPYSHLNVNNVADIYLVDSQLLSAVNNITVGPGGGQSIGLFVVRNSVLDDAQSYAVRMVTAGGTVYEVDIESPWMKGGSGAIYANAASGAMDSFSVRNSFPVGSGGGVGYEFDGIGNVVVRGDRIGNWTTGILLNNVARGHISGNLIGAHGVYPTNGTGIKLTGTSSDVLIEDNHIKGNTTAVDMTGLTGAGNKIYGNLGYPAPGNMLTITVGASPFSYTSGSTPETLFINGGTVSLINVNSVNVLQSSNHSIRLGPGETIIVTYTVAPAMVKSLV